MELRPLDYRTPSKPPSRFKKREWGPAPTDPESKRWRFYRRVFAFGQFLLFGSIAVYFGPNVIMFRKATRPSMSDFTVFVQSNYAPIVQAIKRYQRDTGKLPQRSEDLPAQYTSSTGVHTAAFLCNDQQISFFFGPFNEEIEYSLKPGAEGWSVSGHYVNGPIPLPTVTIESTTRQ